ncbi:hypothetical protein [Cognatitamlana onchidii]|uniref:hypothetical protein n=1 Tax=Cognatitamlana onchidii TaxID=2562860 RepID=UPI0010A626B3|nr:hypothetical protein [Algibacter onchidii]
MIETLERHMPMAINEATKITETLKESLASIAQYRQFLNWMSADFELYLQDYDKDLTIYFPGGAICIQQKENIQSDFINFEIHISSKHKKTFDSHKSRVLLVLNHFKFFCQ